MSRLFDERDSFRSGNDVTTYLEKIIKIIPSEVIGAFIFSLGLLETIKDDQVKLVLKWAILGFLLFIIPLYYRKIANGVPFINHSIISCLAFIVWAYATSGLTLFGPQYYDPAIASISLMMFTLLSSYVPLNR